ncbi:MAG: ISAs1 family transposase [Oscillospiraceae bacterium]|nr:ISAs1 family transposase [Oscillospiraceae bacterium]
MGRKSRNRSWSAESKRKSNEITAVPELLDLTDVENCIIMSDAMSCQKNTVKKICEKNCDYVICLKGNQEMLHGMYSCILKLHLLRHNYIFLSKPSL